MNEKGSSHVVFNSCTCNRSTGVRIREDRRRGSVVFIAAGADFEGTAACVGEDCKGISVSGEVDDTDDSPFDDGTTGSSGAEGVLPMGVSGGRGSTLRGAGR